MAQAVAQVGLGIAKMERALVLSVTKGLLTKLQRPIARGNARGPGRKEERGGDRCCTAGGRARKSMRFDKHPPAAFCRAITLGLQD